MLWNPEEKDRERRVRIDEKKKIKERLYQMQKKQSLLKRLQLRFKSTIKASQNTHLKRKINHA